MSLGIFIIIGFGIVVILTILAYMVIDTLEIKKSKENEKIDVKKIIQTKELQKPKRKYTRKVVNELQDNL